MTASSIGYSRKEKSVCSKHKLSVSLSSSFNGLGFRQVHRAGGTAELRALFIGLVLIWTNTSEEEWNGMVVLANYISNSGNRSDLVSY